MINLIQFNQYNFFINSDTGKWFGFVDHNNKQNTTLIDISKQQCATLFRNDNKIKKIFTYYDEISKKLPNKNDLLTKLNYLILHTSDRCNMHCAYCYAEDNLHDQEAEIMSSKTMIDAIDKFFQGEDLYILFHGREPLTALKEIISTLDHFKENKKLHFILQTNGMMLNDELIQILKKYNVKINISFDGFDDNTNYLRINGTTNKYSAKMTELLKNYKDISPILIVHKKNIKNLKNITSALVNYGHTNFSYNFLWPTRDNESLNKYVVDCDQLFETFKTLFEFSIFDDGKKTEFKFKERDLYLLYGRVVYRHINNYMCNKSPCGAGRICVCVSFNGDVYPCTTVNGQKENYMGNIYKDDVKNIMASDFVLKHRNIKEVEECRNCPFNVFCGGGACPGLLYNYKKNLKLKSIYCNYYKNMILYIMMKCVDVCSSDFFINF